jgi:glycosyltransferase involved in cell wall biosynthesis
VCSSDLNGEKYLKAQLDSLFSQSYKEYQIIARDDGSSDKTLEILNAYDIELVPFTHNLGAKGSFSALLDYALTHTDAEYFMFCDQDDVWESDKIEKTLAKMQEMEQAHLQTPLLVHSDLAVVDQDLQALSPSLWSYQNIDPAKDALNRLLFHNVVTGCTMMINRKLALLSLPIADEAIMHDWWIVMVASVFGHIGFIDEPLIRYRQHGKNDTGAKRYGMRYYLDRFIKKPSFDKYILQAKAFLQMYGDSLSQTDREMLAQFVQIDKMGWMGKRLFLIKNKILKNGIVRNIGLLVFI